ncbi:MAG: putative amidohydrolase [Paracoccaceae bacterium]|jgi:predicted amidohydrolase
MERLLNVACLQTRPMPDFDQALVEATKLAQEAVKNGAEFIALPEYCGGLKTEGGVFTPPFASENEHPVLLGLQQFAKDNAVAMLIGSVAIPGPDGKIRNRSFLVNKLGQTSAVYDKIHMFDIQLSENEVYRESAKVSAGDTAVVTDMGFAKIGQSVCYDLRFPDLYRRMAQNGAEMLTIPAAFTKKTGEAHWHVLNRARAIENCAFVVAPCSVGLVDGGGEAYGHSLIINPWGEVLAEGSAETGVIQATINLDEVANARAKIPSLNHDRPFGVQIETKANVT